MPCGNEKNQGCQKPENLKGHPRQYSPEQIRGCHGSAQEHPCAEPAGCEHTERLKGRPGECSPEQVRQCHGAGTPHPCVPESRK